MQFPVRAITLDLDDTVWPFAPIGERIERALDDWLREHCPRTAERFPIPAMRKLRTRVYQENAHLAHDMSALRRLCIERALREAGDDIAHVDAAYEVFFAARNEVECYPDSVAALERIAARVPIAALTNGNADLGRIGLQRHFVFQLGAGEHGKAKPSPCIFHAACKRLDCDHGQVLHVGDHIESDVAGAARAGLRSCWINREGRSWRHDEITPDLEFDSLAGLADWLEAGPRHAPDRSTTA
ncbi:MAG: HAD family hydrolase [Luteimonas sp.]